MTVIIILYYMPLEHVSKQYIFLNNLLMGPVSQSVCSCRTLPDLSNVCKRTRSLPFQVLYCKQAPGLTHKHQIRLDGLPRTNTLAYWTHSEVTKKIKCCKYGHLSICSQKAFPTLTKIFLTLRIGSKVLQYRALDSININLTHTS